MVFLLWSEATTQDIWVTPTLGAECQPRCATAVK